LTEKQLLIKGECDEIFDEKREVPGKIVVDYLNEKLKKNSELSRSQFNNGQQDTFEKMLKKIEERRKE
jgi:hypothetical protein